MTLIRRIIIIAFAAAVLSFAQGALTQAQPTKQEKYGKSTAVEAAAPAWWER
jgi:hypothetical protein